MNSTDAPKIGDNTQTVDFAKQEMDRLHAEYGHFISTVESLLDEAAAITLPIEDDAGKSAVTSLIKRQRDTAKRILGVHVVEKEPHLRRSQADDQFFFGLVDKLARRDRKNRPGSADNLGEALTAYDTKLLLAEQERRRKIAEEEARKAAAAREAELKALREAEEARLAAERARKPETQAAKEAVAEHRETEASTAKIESTLAERAAEDAYVQTLAKPADIMRNRGDDGTLSTMATEGYAELVDKRLLDKEALWPFIKPDAIEQALRAYAKANDFRVTMNGAKIGRRPKSVVR
jgi:hypothetical protein